MAALTMDVLTQAPAAAGAANAPAPVVAPPLAGVPPYWPHSEAVAEAHGKLFKKLTRRTEPHVFPPRLPQPAGFERGDGLARILLLHYPRLGKKPYFDPDTGHPSDQTLVYLERAVQAAYPKLTLTFGQMFDWVGDLFDGGAPLNFDFNKDFFKPLSKKQKEAWWESKVAYVAAVLVDEIVERKRVGAIVAIAGVNPIAIWPKLLASALPIAIAAAEDILDRPVTFEIKYLSELPELEPGRNGERPPEREGWELQHPSTAATTMASDECKRWDAAILQVFGAGTEYFQRLKKKHGDYNAAEMLVLQAHAKARHYSLTKPLPYFHLCPHPQLQLQLHHQPQTEPYSEP